MVVAVPFGPLEGGLLPVRLAKCEAGLGNFFDVDVRIRAEIIAENDRDSLTAAIRDDEREVPLGYRQVKAIAKVAKACRRKRLGMASVSSQCLRVVSLGMGVDPVQDIVGRSPLANRGTDERFRVLVRRALGSIQPGTARLSADEDVRDVVVRSAADGEADDWPILRRGHGHRLFRGDKEGVDQGGRSNAGLPEEGLTGEKRFFLACAT